MSIDALSSGRVSQVSSLLAYQKTTSIQVSNQSGNGNFGPAVNITISTTGLNFLQQSSTSLGFETEGAEDDGDILSEVFEGVSEELFYAAEDDLSVAELGQILEAGEAFSEQANAILREANGGPLSDAQLDRLFEAEDAFFEATDSVYGEPFADSQLSLIEQSETAFENLLESSENPINGQEPSDVQLLLLEAVENQFYEAIDNFFSSKRETTPADEKQLANVLETFEARVTDILEV